ncbi:MAG: PEP-CTERM sorting domain-containing protein [Planctomycetota bacterium]
MSLKSLALLLVAGFTAATVSAAPSLSFVDNADGTGAFQITPDDSLFETAAGGSIAFEIEITGLTVGSIASATANTTDFPRSNPGNFDGGIISGLVFDASSLTAAFGSDLFTTNTAVDAVTIDFGGAADFTYKARVAQAGAATFFPVGDPQGTLAGSVTLGGQEGDFNLDGSVDNADLNLLLNNWGAATVPPEWTGAFTPNVNNDELNALLNNWGTGTSVSVPEPTSLLILSVVGLAAGVRRNG